MSTVTDTVAAPAAPATAPAPTRGRPRKDRTPKAEESEDNSKKAAVQSASESTGTPEGAPKPKSAQPLCQQCVRAVTFVHRLNAAVELYRTCCEAAINDLEPESTTRTRAVELRDAANMTVRHAFGDSQYLLRTLVCTKNCITPNTHAAPAPAASE